MAACLFCAEPLRHTLVDLGMSPLCESYLTAEQLNQMEPFYPLHVWVCERCFLVQVEEYVRPEGIFTEYAYFSSYSDSWLAHMKAYADMITMSLLRSRPVRNAASPSAAPKLGVGDPSRVAHSPTKIRGPLRSVES